MKLFRLFLKVSLKVTPYSKFKKKMSHPCSTIVELLPFLHFYIISILINNIKKEII